MANDTKLDWQPVDTDVMKGPLKTAFDKYLKVHEAQRKEWDAFLTTAMPRAQKMAPEGQEAILTYKRGKLLLAFREAKGGVSNAKSEGAITL